MPAPHRHGRHTAVRRRSRRGPLTRAAVRRVCRHAALACLLVGTAACCPGEAVRLAAVPFPSARLVEPGDGGRQSFGLRTTVRGQPYLFGNLALCLDRTGVADVVDVRFDDPTGGMTVEAWALRPFYRPMGADGVGWGEPDSLRRRKLSTSLSTVTEVCRPDDSSRVEFAELVVQTSRPRGVSASSSGVVVRYTSGASEGVLRIPFGITLCAPSERSLPLCQSKT
ncbi:hypothetical protein [Sphaerisporangium fuscum]|uniref:hypothetical protein n=1 Tax=Sphaerisporangium fuscum TaxID=2835868 RepID=UPI001BDC35E4|nr:hypothetical protein [Sphaerisporangium fuscum]